MTKYKGKYRIESTRLKEWDYSNPWWYYATINTKHHHQHFGNIENNKMNLNELGIIVQKCWNDIPNHFPEVELDYSVIMPNHIHGIIIINPTVETGHAPSLQKHLPSLSNIIGSFKSAVTKSAYEKGYSSFAWQPRFYDRIVRNEKELASIRIYIELNPLKWELEKDKLENIFEL